MVCLECIRDETLREETRRVLGEWECSFCGSTADEAADEPIAASFEDFMYIVMPAVNFLYMPVGDAGLVYDDGEWIGGKVLDSADVAYAVCEGLQLQRGAVRSIQVLAKVARSWP